MEYCLKLSDVSPKDYRIVGGKNIGLKKLHDIGIKIPKGIAVTTAFFDAFVNVNKLDALIRNLNESDGDNVSNLLRNRIKNGVFPDYLAASLEKAIARFEGKPLTVRSSCTHEDLKYASFSGQYESYLNIIGFCSLKKAVMDCYGSAYSPRALAYVRSYEIKPEEIRMAICVQELIPSRSSGVVFTVHPQCGSPDLVYIEANNGYGESVVGGDIDPDIFVVHKSSMQIVKRKIGKKEYIYAMKKGGGLRIERNSQNGFSLTDEEIMKICRLSMKIEKEFGSAQDIEFVIDDNDQIVITQAREQILPRNNYIEVPSMNNDKRPAVIGDSISKGVGIGVPVYKKRHYAENDIPILDKLDVSDIPKVKHTQGLIIKKLNSGSHSASILRELSIPSISNIEGDLASIINRECTINSLPAKGGVSIGRQKTEIKKIPIGNIAKPKTHVYMVCSSPERLFNLRYCPIEGIGLLRSEFVINYEIGIHPLALIDYDGNSLDNRLVKSIRPVIEPFGTGREFFVTKLAEAVLYIMALLPGKTINYRFCDFKSNEYIGLVGGERYETTEMNPMIGLRGTTRLLSKRYSGILELECMALQRICKAKVGELQLLVPFCRTPEDGMKLREAINAHLKSNLKVGLMLELPSNFLLAKEFAQVFDFFVLGPKDLTQTVYAIDWASDESGRYKIDSAAPKAAIETFFYNINGMKKDVLISHFGLFCFVMNNKKLISNNRIHLNESSDKIINTLETLPELEKNWM